MKLIVQENIVAIMFLLSIFVCNPARCQQFNSDNYLSKPCGTSIVILTYGQNFTGTNGAQFEVGIMLFTPPFCCLGRSNKKTCD